MTNLLENLTMASKELKADYINSCVDFAEVDFIKLTAMRDGLRASYQIEDEAEKEAFLLSEVEKYTGPIFNELKSFRTYYAKAEKSNKIVRKGLDAYLVASEESAKKHFETSLKKLEVKIIKKGLNLDTISLKSGYVEHNFNCLITDNNGKQVKAQTILAMGEVQKPHYRYLVK